MTTFTAGCVFTPFEAASLDMVPGSYFVEQREDKLFALSLARPDTLDAPNEDDWVPVEATDWYSGPGVYVLTNELQWTPSRQLSAPLDDIIQLNDAPPAAPAD